VKQKLVVQLFEVPTWKFQLQLALFGVVQVKSTHKGAQPDAGVGLVVNDITGSGFTVMVTVEVASGLVHPSSTVTVYVVVVVGLTVHVLVVIPPGDHE
jgi:hypothetical protein